MFYPNKCTNILATCDGGLIRQLQMDFRKKVERELEDFFDEMTGSDILSTKIQREFIMKTYNKSIESISTEAVKSVALRCGAMFELNDSLEKQFSGVKLRGYTEGGIEEKADAGEF